jgi:pSer/pThr/pTyr-binding forkhead associated (FHA) protein
MISPKHIEVTASYLERSDHFQTAVMQREQEAANLEALQALDAFLIVQGRNHVALDRPVTRIGRRFDNDIVLESPAVSRLHAQIRWRDHFFVLYDVGGRGRTQVNGQPTREHVLRPGDVIALSDVLIIYGEGGDSRGNHAAPLEQGSSVTLTRDEE